MKVLRVKLANCYGIKKLEADFDFSRKSSCPNAYAIYAPNGAMKSSFAQTFKDVSEAKQSCDRIFPDRVCTRSVQDETGVELSSHSVVVISPYDGACSHAERTSTLLVDGALRTEYEQLHVEVDKAEAAFLSAIERQSGIKKDIQREISATFTSDSVSFHLALNRVKDEVSEMSDAPFADIDYRILFSDQVLSLFEQEAIRKELQTYVAKYNELLAKSA